MEYTDFLINCGDPQKFDETIQKIATAVLMNDPNGYKQIEGHYVMRVFGDSGYLQFAIKNQGYGTIIKKLE